MNESLLWEKMDICQQDKTSVLFSYRSDRSSAQKVSGQENLWRSQVEECGLNPTKGLSDPREGQKSGTCSRQQQLSSSKFCQLCLVCTVVRRRWNGPTRRVQPFCVGVSVHRVRPFVSSSKLFNGLLSVRWKKSLSNLSAARRALCFTPWNRRATHWSKSKQLKGCCSANRQQQMSPFYINVINGSTQLFPDFWTERHQRTEGRQCRWLFCCIKIHQKTTLFAEEENLLDKSSQQVHLFFSVSSLWQEAWFQCLPTWRGEVGEFGETPSSSSLLVVKHRFCCDKKLQTNADQNSETWCSYQTHPRQSKHHQLPYAAEFIPRHSWRCMIVILHQNKNF